MLSCLFKTKPVKTLDDHKLENDNIALQRQVENLQAQVEMYRLRLEGEYAEARYSVDWAAINAFSIERIIEGTTQKTIIGHILSEPTVTTEGAGDQRVTYKDIVREWTLYCSHKEHQRLVEEFELFRKGRV